MKKILPIIIIVLVIAVLGVSWKLTRPSDQLGKTELIRVDSPRPNQTISSPLTIVGEARGNWYFEASFPVVLTNWDGLVIAQGIAQAKGDWMTTDFVPFEATLTFMVDKNTYSNRGSLILKKDNPSGLLEHDDALEIPIMFAGVTATPTPTSSGIRGTILLGPTCPVMRDPPDPQCADKPLATTILVYRAGSNTVIATGKSTANGTFEISLPPGTYTLVTQGGTVLPRCSPVDAVVGQSGYVTADISCDTGIR